jgi:ribosomal protein S18 acetylase RimI-like enzyme
MNKTSTQKTEKKKERSLSPRSRYDESKFVSYDEKYMALTKAQLADLLKTVDVKGVKDRSKVELCSIATFFHLKLPDVLKTKTKTDVKSNVPPAKAPEKKDYRIFYEKMTSVPQWIIKMIEIEKGTTGSLAVHVIGERVVAYVLGEFQSIKRAEIDSVGVHPEFRGKKLCKPLVKFFMENMIQRGATSISVLILSEHQKAACFCYIKAAQEAGLTKIYDITLNNTMLPINSQTFCSDDDPNKRHLLFSLTSIGKK